MSRNGWLIGFLAAWFISLVDENAVIDIMAPFAIGAVAFSTQRTIVSMLWTLEALQEPALMLLRLAVIGLSYLLASIYQHRFVFIGPIIAAIYCFILHVQFPMSLLIAVITFAILISGREKLEPILPSSITKVERGIHNLEDYRHRRRTRTTGPRSGGQRAQRSRHQPEGIMAASSPAE